MNKRVLVLTLALIVALAGSAMASVEFSGEFTAKAEQDSLKVFVAPYTVTADLSLNVKAIGEDVDWKFSGALSRRADGTFGIGKYALSLTDDYFKAWVWGNGHELSDKATYFSMISAGKAAPGVRARLEVPVLDYATITADLAQPDNFRAFVDSKFGGFDLGLAYARKAWTTAAKDVVVAQAGTDVDLGDISVNLKAAGGVTIDKNLGFAVGFSAASDVTEQVNVKASVEHANKDWAGDAVATEKTAIAASATYSDTALNVALTGNYGIDHSAAKTNTNGAKLVARYRMSEVVAYGNLFAAAHYWKNTAPAFGAEVEMKNSKFDHVQADVASPVLADMIWARAYGRYNGDKTYEAGAFGYIIALADSKLVVKPSVVFKSAKTTTDVQLAADYKVGTGTATLTFLAQKIFAPAAADQKSKLSLSVKVPF